MVLLLVVESAISASPRDGEANSVSRQTISVHARPGLAAQRGDREGKHLMYVLPLILAIIETTLVASAQV